MNKKISKKDLKDWKNFIEGKEKIYNKDIAKNSIKIKKLATLDLHGFSLDKANIKVENFIKDCFYKKVQKINIITGKGLRSKIEQNPYQSRDLAILKYSVPEFIKSNSELMKLVKKMDDQMDNKNMGYFSVYLRSKNKF